MRPSIRPLFYWSVLSVGVWDSAIALEMQNFALILQIIDTYIICIIYEIHIIMNKRARSLIVFSFQRLILFNYDSN